MHDHGRPSLAAAPPSATPAEPGRTTVPPPAQRLLTLQRAAGNRAVARLVSERLHAGPRRLARLKWAPTDVIKEADLSPRLAAALALARQHPGALPNLPAWVRTVIKTGMGYDQQVDDWKADYLAKAQPKWNALPQAAQDSPKYGGDIQKFAALGQARPLAAFEKGLEGTITTIEGEFKWGADFWNLKGDLPGTQHPSNPLPPAGTGGYREYYAEPEAIHVGPLLGTWGKNRVLHKVTADGGYPDSWWVTDDHYTNFKLVVP